MLKRFIVISGALISLAAVGFSQENSPGVSGTDAIAARQARALRYVLHHVPLDGG